MNIVNEIAMADAIVVVAIIAVLALVVLVGTLWLLNHGKGAIAISIDYQHIPEHHHVKMRAANGVILSAIANGCPSHTISYLCTSGEVVGQRASLISSYVGRCCSDREISNAVDMCNIYSKHIEVYHLYES